MMVQLNGVRLVWLHKDLKSKLECIFLGHFALLVDQTLSDCLISCYIFRIRYSSIRRKNAFLHGYLIDEVYMNNLFV